MTGLWRRGLWIEQLPRCHIQDVNITAPWALTNIGKGKGRMFVVGKPWPFINGVMGPKWDPIFLGEIKLHAKMLLVVFEEFAFL